MILPACSPLTSEEREACSNGYFQWPDYSGPTGARQFVRDMYCKLEAGVVFTTVVPYSKGTGAGCLDREAFLRSWLALYCRKAADYLERCGTPFTLEDL